MGRIKTRTLCRDGGPLDGAYPLIANSKNVHLVARVYISRAPGGQLVITQDLKLAHAYVRNGDHFLYDGPRATTPKDVVELKKLT